MKNVWSNRNLFVKDYIPNNISIVDFGCGNKEILDFTSPSKYLGIDLTDDADLKLNLNEPIELADHFDLGLLLGVLEYVTDPDQTLSNITQYADKFIILSLAVKKKDEWTNAFTMESIDVLMQKHFKTVEHYVHGRYILSIGKV